MKSYNDFDHINLEFFIHLMLFFQREEKKKNQDSLTTNMLNLSVYTDYKQ